ncbi:cytochrome c oxidase assembly factor 7 homolog [Zootermopsis nevadensis]|uniref:Hcp beta-lactamase-like protein n=1 Tax=Zootermopsis nevadensis TaxID=136037 RepID=A0A067R657_ZOONE|nr:cytochrome c oxidase assembly factor 7 homolog [Zootermopsis nevadensis]KDR18864.1 Hcp beta-lactamase-like protein [Zootermopsis nevadensis]
MAFDLRDESQVKEFIHNLGIEYRFGCYSEKKPEVCHLLGDYLESIKKDYAKAGKIYKSNCDDYNFGRSCYKFGTYTLLGRGKLVVNPEVAYEYFQKGCELGVSESCMNAGLMCLGNGPYKRNRKDYNKGLEQLDKGCEGNDPFCCYYIGAMYISGIKEANIAKDMSKAYRYSEKGCALGNMYACANISQMYQRGDGVVKDKEKAEQYKKRALELQDELMKQQQTLEFQQGNKQV